MFHKRKIRETPIQRREASVEFFTISTDSDGISLVTFNRPPVNALSYDVYREIRELAETLEASEETRVVILTAPKGARAWCGGADLNDFLPLDYDARMARYALVNETMPRFYALERPVIAAVNAPTVGVGIVLASFCDIRIGADRAFFASPEIDRGVLAGGGGFYARLNMPQGIIRELIYTGRRFSAQEMLQHGYLNYVLPEDEVLDKAYELARIITKKSLPALKANKRANNAAEALTWQEAYKMTNSQSAELTITSDAKEGIKAFLDGRSPEYADK
jgi:enoyl-CoA hydratase/carnithine racemase